MNDLSADEVIRLLGLLPHPEGGFYRETFRAPAAAGQRGACTAIYYLLPRGQRSAWHKVDAVEIWHWYAGGPLRLSISRDGVGTEHYALGNDLSAYQRPQVSVPAFAWQAAEPLGDWTLVGCTVAPAFSFDGFTMAPEGWTPGNNL